MAGPGPRRALLGATAAVLAAAAPARADTIRPLSRADAPTRGPLAGTFRDRVISGRPTRARGFSGTTTHVYRAADGTPIEISISPSFPDNAENRAGAQAYADFLGSRLHGPELRRLRVFIGTPAEVNLICGGGSEVLACYSRIEARMYVPSEDPPGGGQFTRPYAVTHEYGHHIANFRFNDPFPALDYGPKYWSSYEHVCAGVRARRYFPGNQGSHYLQDPGEAWADSYAHLHYPGVVWQFAPSLRPDAGAFAAIRRDILNPWTGRRSRSFAGSLGEAARSRSFAFGLSLDGDVTLRLHGPRGANFDLRLVGGGRALLRSHAPGAGDELGELLCRAPSSPTATVRVRVLRVSGAGSFRLRAVWPG